MMIIIIIIIIMMMMMIHFNSADIYKRLPESTHISQRRLEFSCPESLEVTMLLYYKNKAWGISLRKKV